MDVFDKYYEDYINPEAISRKDYGANRLVSSMLYGVVRFSSLINCQDEIVVYARKKTGKTETR